MSFYIEKIIIDGPGKTSSTIDLKSGVNIIYGPSNTGKSCIVRCIDYMFGSDREPFDGATGYQMVKIIIKTEYGSITMSRKLNEKIIFVSSTDERIPSDKYKTTTDRNNYQRTINFVWLTLIGIEDMHLIIKNENYEKQILSWKTFSHMFMLSETKIISEVSAILSDRSYFPTAIITSLIFLLTGEDFAQATPLEKKEIKDAKRKAIREYINKELFRLSERNQELTSILKEKSKIDIKAEAEKIIADISEYDNRLQLAIAENQNLLGELHSKNERLSECNVLLDRYNELNTQYKADIKRLSFIIDGKANMKNTYASKCPFCDGQVTVKSNSNYIDAAIADYEKIKCQEHDLENALKELVLEKEKLEQEINTLRFRKNSTEELINNEIKPKISMLKEKLSAYKQVVEIQKELDVLKIISNQKTADIIENEVIDNSELKFRAKEHLEFDFISTLSGAIKSLLEKCKYDDLFSLSFDKSTMDIIVNGKKKSFNGKGYNAFYNSVVAIALSRYMYENAKYAPNFLVLDSPILSLKDKETKKPSDTMGSALFENIIETKENIQTIVIENNIPDINYEGVNLIHFTKEKNNGRYGFLLDVAD